MTLENSNSVRPELQSERTTAEPFESGAERRQYTIKGIEGQTLDLMRTAARKEGMKVGAWVSMRLREAADRALNREGDAKFEIDGLREHINKLEQERKQDADRIRKIQEDIFEITKSQSVIMTRLLSA